MRSRFPLSAACWMSALVVSVGAGCGASLSRDEALDHLRRAQEEPIASAETMRAHNRLAVDVRDAQALEGLRRDELQARLGRGEDCGVRALCHEQGFRATDWTYELGRSAHDPTMPDGPTLILGFDSTGRVDRVFTRTRETAR